MNGFLNLGSSSKKSRLRRLLRWRLSLRTAFRGANDRWPVEKARSRLGVKDESHRRRKRDGRKLLFSPSREKPVFSARLIFRPRRSRFSLGSATGTESEAEKGVEANNSSPVFFLTSDDHSCCLEQTFGP